MRSEYSKALRIIVEREMQASAFGWQLEKLKSQYVFPGERAFKRAAGNGLIFWCVLVPHNKFEKFTFEIGWSKLDRFPQLKARPSLTRPEDALGLEEYFVRLGQIKEGTDHWWEIESFKAPSNVDALVTQMQRIPGEDAIARVEPIAKDAVSALESFGVPYLQKVIQP